ncbi:MAG: hypothetical protein QNJ68_07475 [Microcoleaceae cyanobacterium MO_207.B10]|nr:hypothetical protein [Microcoleaceae cyanobacterium MO_207.B10]
MASIRKNGHRGDKQNYICVSFGRQFLDFYDPSGYTQDIKALLNLPTPKFYLFIFCFFTPDF